MLVYSMLFKGAYYVGGILCLYIALLRIHWGEIKNNMNFISYLLYYLHCCTLPDKRCLSQGILNDVADDAESIQNRKLRHNR